MPFVAISASARRAASAERVVLVGRAAVDMASDQGDSDTGRRARGGIVSLWRVPPCRSSAVFSSALPDIRDNALPTRSLSSSGACLSGLAYVVHSRGTRLAGKCLVEHEIAQGTHRSHAVEFHNSATVFTVPAKRCDGPAMPNVKVSGSLARLRRGWREACSTFEAPRLCET